MNHKAFLLGLFVTLSCTLKHVDAQGGGKSNIRIDQIGYFTNGPKIAVVLNSDASTFSVTTVSDEAVYSGILTKSIKPDFAGKYTLIANFSAFNKPGKYILKVPGLGDSYLFSIKASVFDSIADASIKAFYYMRASIPLAEKYAGKWNRAEGHPDTNVLVHSSAADAKRPAGTVISSPRGWYDAGDYNKYVVNSGISTGTLLSLYEDFPAYMKTVQLNIPESGNGLPDVLNEVLWNLRWMLTMQDPHDGGVYHKLTNAAFDGMEMPEKGIATRYVVQKGTAATLDFAAVMAQASRILAKFPLQLPGLADSCFKASERAWEWAKKYPDIAYDQDELNKKFIPKITTGAYDDHDFTDEFIWAASELAVTTGKNDYLKTVSLIPDKIIPLPSWGQVRLLGYYSLIRNNRLTNKDVSGLASKLNSRLIAFADSLISGVNNNAYQTVMSNSAKNFGWGSNSVAANQGIALIQAYLLTHNSKYLTDALDNLDYLLGRNGTGYSYVTGYGSETPMHPHHRPSVSDGITKPIPGLLVGGPNPGMQDGIKVPSTIPDEAYIDDDRAYAANEIAINWNAPFAYLANALEALQGKI